MSATRYRAIHKDTGHTGPVYDSALAVTLWIQGLADPTGWSWEPTTDRSQWSESGLCLSPDPDSPAGRDLAKYYAEREFTGD